MKTALWPERLKSFRDKYLAFLLIVMATFFTGSAVAQYDSTKKITPQAGVGFEYLQIETRYKFRLPNDTVRLRCVDSGAVAFKGGNLWLWKRCNWYPIIGNVVKINDSTILIGTDTVKVGGTGGGNVIAGRNLIKYGNTIALGDTIELSLARFSHGAGDSAYIGWDNKDGNSYPTKLEIENWHAGLPPPSVVLDSSGNLVYRDGPFGQVLDLDTSRFYTRLQVYSREQTDSIAGLAVDSVYKNLAGDTIIVRRKNGEEWRFKDSSSTSAPGLGDPGVNGYVVRTNENTTVARQLQGTEGRVTVTNPSGVPGNTIFDIGAKVVNKDSSYPDPSWLPSFDYNKLINVPGDTIPLGQSNNITIAALRALASPSRNVVYYITDAGRQGLFQYSATETRADNGGTVLAAANGDKFIRIYSGPIDPRWFGVIGGSSSYGTANTTAILAALTAARSGEKVLLLATGVGSAGEVWTNGNINLNSDSAGKKMIFESQAVIRSMSNTAFTVGGHKSTVLILNNTLIGPNSLVTDSASYAARPLGRGVYLADAWHAEVKVDYILGFHTGLESSGDGQGITYAGNQYNYIYFNWIDNNYIQLKLSHYSTPLGKFSNENYIYGGQIGRATADRVNKYYNGVFGIVINSGDAGISPSGITRNALFHVSIEGVAHGLVMSLCEKTMFDGLNIESTSVAYQISMDEASCRETFFVNCPIFFIDWIQPGKKGLWTVVTGNIWKHNGVTQNYIGNRAVSIPGESEMLVTSESYPGGTAWNSFDGYNKRSLLAERFRNYNGQFKWNDSTYFGSWAQLPTYVTAASGDTVNMQIFPGYTSFDADQATALRIPGNILSLGEIPEFLVEKNNTFALTIVRGDNNVVVIPSSSFSSTGLWRIKYRNYVWKITKADGGGGGGGISAISVDTSGNHSFPEGFSVSGGVAEAGVAFRNHPGVVNNKGQIFFGSKWFDDLRSDKITFDDSIANPTTRFILQKFPSGLSFDPDGLPNPSSTTQWGFGISGRSATKNAYIALQKYTQGTGFLGFEGRSLVAGVDRTDGFFDVNIGQGFSTYSPTAGVRVFRIGFNGIPIFPLMAGSGESMAVFLADGSMARRAVPTGNGTGSGWPGQKAPDSTNYHFPAGLKIGGTYGNPQGYLDVRGSSTTLPGLIIGSGVTTVAKIGAIERFAVGISPTFVGSDNIRRYFMMMPSPCSPGEFLQLMPDGTTWGCSDITGGVNIYNANGTLTGARILTQGANNLRFTGTGEFQKYFGSFRVSSSDVTGATSTKITGNTITGQTDNGTTWVDGTLNLNSSSINITSAGPLTIDAGTQLIDMKGSIVVNYADITTTSLTMSSATQMYFYRGGTTTWTLPSGPGYGGLEFKIKNAGAGTLTIQRAGSDLLYTTSGVTSISISPGQSVTITRGDFYWYVL